MSWKPIKGQRWRPKETYRGTRRKLERGARKSLIVKADRKKRGETRSQSDRRRRLGAVERERRP